MSEFSTNFHDVIGSFLWMKVLERSLHSYQIYINMELVAMKCKYYNLSNFKIYFSEYFNSMGSLICNAFICLKINRRLCCILANDVSRYCMWICYPMFFMKKCRIPFRRLLTEVPNGILFPENSSWLLGIFYVSKNTSIVSALIKTLNILCTKFSVISMIFLSLLQ